jgi:hypothetical protein
MQQPPRSSTQFAWCSTLSRTSILTKEGAKALAWAWTSRKALFYKWRELCLLCPAALTEIGQASSAKL